MYILRFLLAATYLSSTKHPFDTIVHLHDNDVPFAMVFAKKNINEVHLMIRNIG